MNFSSWEAKGSAHTEVAASVSKWKEHLRCSASEDWVKKRHISTNVALLLPPAFLAQIQRNQNALGPVCVRLCESERVYLTSQLAAMTHRRLYLWQKSSLFARHSGSSLFIGGQTAAQDYSGTFVDVMCLLLCIKQSVVILPTFLYVGLSTEFNGAASYVHPFILQCANLFPIFYIKGGPTFWLVGNNLSGSTRTKWMACFGDPPHWRKENSMGYEENMLPCQLKMNKAKLQQDASA